MSSVLKETDLVLSLDKLKCEARRLSDFHGCPRMKNVLHLVQERVYFNVLINYINVKGSSVELWQEQKL